MVKIPKFSDLANLDKIKKMGSNLAENVKLDGVLDKVKSKVDEVTDGVLAPPKVVKVDENAHPIDIKMAKIEQAVEDISHVVGLQTRTLTSLKKDLAALKKEISPLVSQSPPDNNTTEAPGSETPSTEQDENETKE